MGDKLNPQVMEGFIGNGLDVLETAKKIPQGMFKKCAGIMLLSTREFGFFVSGQKGAGVVVFHKEDGSWSAPLAVVVEGSGFGLVLGYAEMAVLVFLSPHGIGKLVEGRQGLRIGADLGLTVGKHGHSAGAGIGGSDGGGGVSPSSVYTFSKGALVNAEVESTAIDVAAGVNQSFYGTPEAKSILDGTAKVPDGTGAQFVSKLHEAIRKHEGE